MWNCPSAFTVGNFSVQAGHNCRTASSRIMLRSLSPRRVEGIGYRLLFAIYAGTAMIAIIIFCFIRKKQGFYVFNSF